MPSRQPRQSRRDRLPPQLAQVHLNAAGIDVGSEFHFVAVPADRDERPVRKFSAFTGDLIALADWLTECGIETVVMESTGVYWIPLFELLEARQFEVLLVDPRRLKSVPGRKTDVLDCQWLQQLHTFGLLSPAFRPEDEVVVSRGYLRQREMLVQCASQHVQHMQKALHQMNVKLDKVLSDITGQTGMLIIQSILDGVRNPHVLAKHRDERCHHDEATIAKALQENWRAEHLFALRQAVALYRMYHQQMVECDAEIAAHLATMTDRSGGTSLPVEKRRRGKRRNEPGFDTRTALHRVTGVDLTRIDGLDGHSVLKIIGEIGTDMSRWQTVKHFTSWLGLCPGNKQSGGKLLSGRTKRCSNGRRRRCGWRRAACITRSQRWEPTCGG